MSEDSSRDVVKFWEPVYETLKKCSRDFERLQETMERFDTRSRIEGASQLLQQRFHHEARARVEIKEASNAFIKEFEYLPGQLQKTVIANQKATEDAQHKSSHLRKTCIVLQNAHEDLLQERKRSQKAETDMKRAIETVTHPKDYNEQFSSA